MAGIFERMSMIARANVNDLMNRFEDPEKIVDQAIIDAKAEYAKVKKDALSVLANENQAQKELDRLKGEAAKWHRIAASALKAGSEADARTALGKEAEYQAQAASQETTLAAARTAANKLREKLKEMENQIQEMEKRSAQIKATAVTARAAKAAAQVSSRDRNQSAFDAFDRMEEKANRQLAEAEALESLNNAHPSAQEMELEKRYSSSSPDVEDALAKLREEIGC